MVHPLGVRLVSTSHSRGTNKAHKLYWISSHRAIMSRLAKHLLVMFTKRLRRLRESSRSRISTTCTFVRLREALCLLLEHYFHSSLSSRLGITLKILCNLDGTQLACWDVVLITTCGQSIQTLACLCTVIFFSLDAMVHLWEYHYSSILLDRFAVNKAILLSHTHTLVSTTEVLSINECPIHGWF